ncbi:Gfo/Idh/MocA family oxidoreductase [Galactobacter sp.]|uniref:Gfo/Idh/MocA family protein n=1 Tax=Galactobacter sp. TaxID=2676125 RepID=UPI0025BC677E|nr:Gfo/Idh/MocA family oxidoreductase [Galactobacter sp.]
MSSLQDAALTIGVIGLGRIGIMHARNLAQQPGVEVLVLIGRNQEKLDAAKAELERALAPGAPAEIAGELAPADVETPTIRTRLTSEGSWTDGLDGVVIATSTGTHPELAETAASAGVPQLLEKPLGLDLEHTANLAARLEAYGTPIMVAFHRRYDQGYQELRRQVQSRELGLIRQVAAVDHDHYHVTPDYIPTSGGIWRDLVIHDFDVIPWILGEEPVSVFASGSVLDRSDYGDHGDLDTATAVVTFESGVQAVVSAGRRIGTGQHVDATVYGSEGVAAAGYDSRTPIASTEPDGPVPASTYDEFVNRFEPAFRREIAHFVAMVHGEADSLTSPSAGVTASRLALAAEESVRTGRPVLLAEIKDAVANGEKSTEADHTASDIESTQGASA